MKKFIIHTSIFIALILLTVGAIFLQAGGATDAYYLRFTSKKQTSLIIGTSRAAQGIIPEVINKNINSNFFNYSFTVASSPFGPSYLNSIKKKITTNNNGFFIVTVDPWSISEAKRKKASPIIESDPMLEKMNLVNLNPNIEYLVKCYNQKYYNILSKKKSNKMILHKDGWLEIIVPMDTASINSRLSAKIENYKLLIETTSFSEERYKSLEQTIDFLNTHGQVFLVRLPIHNKMMDVENKFMPDFNAKMQHLKSKTNGYLDLTVYNSDFIYTDGNHLHKNSGKVVSKKIAEWIKLNSTKN